ncbi:Acetyl-coenzyme A transporter 1 [Symbiodinium microadriaticum]|uniref:Acetyl-coenzyme A transporter 1 n=1 Tax=Symbiodinium microadriaticum TaxID=2951 RepID=A0A1Q9EW75_SYMMI|nr:Acetyl-coenzyme A transporter 1 [Symbiodinium microadriaticum]
MAEKSSPAKPNLAVSPKAASPAGASARTLTPRAGPAGAPKAKTRPEVKSAGKPPTESAKKAPTPEKAPDLTGEYGNLALLFLLYTLQGIPMGLGQVFPMILKEYGASYADLGVFSLQSWPFVLKLLWAPLVDSVYFRSIGRRKTWMVPAQLLIGLLMLYTATQLESLIGTREDKPAINTLTGLFLAMNFLCATQDIAVDGWALTMLRKENSNYQATCNAAGQTFGYALGFTGFTVLDHFKLLSLSSFLFGNGIFFLVVTFLVAVAKTEEPEGIVTSYGQMLHMVELKHVRTLFVILVTWKAPFAVCESVAPLKFQEYGIPKEHIAYVTSLLMPMYILLPLLASGWTGGSNPLKLAITVYPLRVLTGPVTAMLAFYTPPSAAGPKMDRESVRRCAATASELMFVSQMAFFAHVSDPTLGGTYMTLLNTMGNLGGRWPPTAAFFLVDALSCKGDGCSYQYDGFYVVTVLCAVLGVLWLVLTKSLVKQLQDSQPSEWKITKKHAD